MGETGNESARSKHLYLLCLAWLLCVASLACVSWCFYEVRIAEAAYEDGQRLLPGNGAEGLLPDAYRRWRRHATFAREASREQLRSYGTISIGVSGLALVLVGVWFVLHRQQLPGTRSGAFQVVSVGCFCALSGLLFGAGSYEKPETATAGRAEVIQEFAVEVPKVPIALDSEATEPAEINLPGDILETKFDREASIRRAEETLSQLNELQSSVETAELKRQLQSQLDNLKRDQSDNVSETALRALDKEARRGTSTTESAKDYFQELRPKGDR